MTKAKANLMRLICDETRPKRERKYAVLEYEHFSSIGSEVTDEDLEQVAAEMREEFSEIFGPPMKKVKQLLKGELKNNPDVARILRQFRNRKVRVEFGRSRIWKKSDRNKPDGWEEMNQLNAMLKWYVRVWAGPSSHYLPAWSLNKAFLDAEAVFEKYGKYVGIK